MCQALAYASRKSKHNLATAARLPDEGTKQRRITVCINDKIHTDQWFFIVVN